MTSPLPSSISTSPPTDRLKYITKLHNKQILVLGGTSGIGFAVAEACLEHGAYVIIAGSSPTRLSSAIDRLKTAYPSASSSDRIRGTTCDLGQADQIETNLTALFTFISKTTTTPPSPKLDHIIFSAGNAFKTLPLSEISMTYIRDQAPTVRLFAAMLLCKIAPHYMAPGPESSIILTGGSIAAKSAAGRGIVAAYSAGLEGLTRGMALDLKPRRVNLVSPGAVPTEAWDRFSQEGKQATMDAWRANTLVGELGTPEDVAEAYLYLMKDRFVTGTVISTDGGRLLC